jgi:hypothetical protein
LRYIILPFFAFDLELVKLPNLFVRESIQELGSHIFTNDAFDYSFR